MPAQATLEAFKARLRGELLQAHDSGYEAARKVYNGMIDRYPRLIVRCANVADVMAAVHFARENDMLLAVRGGGHNAGGLGTCGSHHACLWPGHAQRYSLHHWRGRTHPGRGAWPFDPPIRSLH